jgi:anti-sigma factor RsiW
MTESAPQACTAILTNISGYLDGELAATECDAIERHCATCPRCAALVRGLRETIGLCRNAAAASLPDEVLDRARTSVRRLLDDV